MMQLESLSSISTLALGLFHPPKPDALFMVMTAYFDESGTHGKSSPIMIVGGFVGTDEQWTSLEAELRTLMQKNGVSKLHAKDFRQRNGEFKHMPYEQYCMFNSQFLQIVDNNLTRGVVSILDPVEFRKLYFGKFFKRKGVRPDSAYGLCFRVAVMKAMNYLAEDGKHDDFPLVTVLELGHKNSADAVRIYNQLTDKFKQEGSSWLGPMALQKKCDCLPLAVADSLVYAMYRKSAGLTCNINPNAVPVGPTIPQYYVHKIPVTRVIITPEFLDQLADFV